MAFGGQSDVELATGGTAEPQQPRPDGTLFGKDEREVLADLADPLARALAIAATRSADAAERKEEVGALRRLVTVSTALTPVRLDNPRPGAGTVT